MLSLHGRASQKRGGDGNKAKKHDGAKRQQKVASSIYQEANERRSDNHGGAGDYADERLSNSLACCAQTGGGIEDGGVGSGGTDSDQADTSDGEGREAQRDGEQADAQTAHDGAKL